MLRQIHGLGRWGRGWCGDRIAARCTEVHENCLEGNRAAGDGITVLTFAQDPAIMGTVLPRRSVHPSQHHRSSTGQPERRVCRGSQHCSMRFSRPRGATDACLRAWNSRPRNNPVQRQIQFILTVSRILLLIWSVYPMTRP